MVAGGQGGAEGHALDVVGRNPEIREVGNQDLGNRPRSLSVVPGKTLDILDVRRAVEIDEVDPDPVTNTRGERALDRQQPVIVDRQNFGDAVGAEGGGGARLVRDRCHLVEVLGDSISRGNIDHEEAGQAALVEIRRRSVLDEGVLDDGEETVARRRQGKALEGQIISDPPRAVRTREVAFRQRNPSNHPPIQGEASDQRLDPTVRGALGADQEHPVGTEGQRLRVDRAASEKPSFEVSQGGRVEDLDRGRASRTTDGEGEETRRAVATTVVRHDVEEITTGIVGQPRKPTHQDAVNLEIPRERGFGQQLESELGGRCRT